MSRVCKCISLITLLCSIATLFCGCLNARSVDGYGYVICIGFDLGKQYKYNISLQLQDENSGTSDTTGSASTESSLLVSAEANTLIDAATVMESSLPYLMNFSRTSIIAVSEEIARQGLMEELFMLSWEMLKIRTSANVVICQGSSADFLNGLSYSQNTSVAKIEHRLVTFYRENAMINLMSIEEFISGMRGDRYDPVLPLCAVDESVSPPEESSSGDGSSGESSDSDNEKKKDSTAGTMRTGGMRSYASGSALFDGSRMVGTITAEQTQLMLMTQGKLEGASVNMLHSDGKLYVLHVGNIDKPAVKASINGDNVHIEYDIRLYVRLEMETSEKVLKEIRSIGRLTEEMETRLINYIKKELVKLFEGCREIGCDVLGTGKHAVRLFTSVKKWEAFDYSERVRDTTAEFNINVELEDIYVSSYMD